MSNIISMPQLGESITEGTISRWLKDLGDFVAKDEPLVEITTDKVTAEMPSPVEGVLQKMLASEGQVVKVGESIAVVEGSQPASSVAQATSEEPVGALALPSSSFTLSPAGRVKDSPEAVERAIKEASEVVEGARQRSSPLVRRLAQEYGVDISKVQGTGLSGRVTRDDLLNYVKQLEAATAAKQSPTVPPSTPLAGSPRPSAALSQPAPEAGDGDQIIEPGTMRRMIAEHMVRSKHTAPHATTMQEVDMTGIVRWREGIREDFKRREGVDLTFLPFVVKATVEALKELPMMNSSWVDDQIIVKKRINVGVAVALEDGLIVPVIHNADERSIAGLAKAVSDLAARARNGKLSLNDIQGGTFTVNNTGALGSIASVPIINQPQAAIVTMEAIVKRPVVIDDAIAIRSMMNICLSFDHRLVDGAIANRFLTKVKTWLEAFGPQTPIY